MNEKKNAVKMLRFYKITITSQITNNFFLLAEPFVTTLLPEGFYFFSSVTMLFNQFLYKLFFFTLRNSTTTFVSMTKSYNCNCTSFKKHQVLQACFSTQAFCNNEITKRKQQFFLNL